MALYAESGKADGHLSVTLQGEQAAFLQNILESLTEYSIIGEDLSGKIQFWNATPVHVAFMATIQKKPLIRTLNVLYA